MSDFTPLEDAERGTPIYVSVGRFSMTEKGLVAKVGKDKEVWISDAFEIVGRVRDPHGEGWGKLLRWEDPDGRTHNRVYTVDRTGWHEILNSKVFVLPNRTFGGVTSEEMIEEVILNGVSASPKEACGYDQGSRQNTLRHCRTRVH